MFVSASECVKQFEDICQSRIHNNFSRTRHNFGLFRHYSISIQNSAEHGSKCCRIGILMLEKVAQVQDSHPIFGNKCDTAIVIIIFGSVRKSP